MSTVSSTPARGLHHVGLTVADLERSAGFYEEVFGGEREWTIEAEGEGVSAMTRVPGTAMRVTSLKLPYGSLELFEFQSPEGRANDRRLNDVGATHVCLEVDDVDAVHEKLVEHDVEIWYPPQESTEGPLAGLRFFYFQDLDGLMVEVLRPPEQGA